MTFLRDGLREVDTSRRSLQRFGWSVGTILLIIGLFMLWRRGGDPGIASSLFVLTGGLLLGTGTVRPLLLRGTYLAWMSLALVLGFVSSHVILALLFYLVITPTGIVRRLVADPMQRRRDPGASSYWLPRTDERTERDRLEKYY